jgi:2-polyprenyl-3-methyl-5-hydroxy-6-metoxy-1,4-benzoquinol methylase
LNSNYQEEVKKGVRFEFGKNWKSFIDTVEEKELMRAAEDIKNWLGRDSFSGKRILDIGSGSGIHSYAFYLMDAGELISFDYDEDSVEATRRMWNKAGEPRNWKVESGSVLDAQYIDALGGFDVVYSWGVLHHTGSMWEAIGNAASLVAPGGLFWIAIYQKGPHYEKDLELKRRYNRASAFGKRLMTWKWIGKLMLRRLMTGKNPFSWNQKMIRGMNVYHDIIDWLGGLPYEVANLEEISEFCSGRGLELVKHDPLPEGGCSSYLFKRID